jgi:ABC-type dipeptide/oligopeptide/nickel transport system ATPase subunit
MENSTNPFIVCDELVKIYQTNGVETTALAGLDLEVRQGEVLAIVGPRAAARARCSTFSVTWTGPRPAR